MRGVIQFCITLDHFMAYLTLVNQTFITAELRAHKKRKFSCNLLKKMNTDYLKTWKSTETK